MALGDELRADVGKLIGEPWRIRDGRVVPGTDDIGLFSNDAVKLDVRASTCGRSSRRMSQESR
ncbi:hypothetical protein A6A07_31415 [Streptomyces sp. CB03911]|nr:hypothetical protein A6A07_31415 [Streptomyces sp. CB03911]